MTGKISYDVVPYIRKDVSSYITFKNQLDMLARKTDSIKDIVIDFAEEDIRSNEVAAIIRATRYLTLPNNANKKRTIRLVVKPGVRYILEDKLKMNTMKNIAFYDRPETDRERKKRLEEERLAKEAEAEIEAMIGKKTDDLELVTSLDEL